MNAQRDIQSISEQLCQFVRANLLANHAGFNEHSLLAEVGIDSYSLVELLLFSERNFGISVPESHLTRENLGSVASLAHCILALSPTGESSGS
jgi:acyl carrier protein